MAVYLAFPIVLPFRRSLSTQ